MHPVIVFFLSDISLLYSKVPWLMVFHSPILSTHHKQRNRKYSQARLGPIYRPIGPEPTKPVTVRVGDVAPAEYTEISKIEIKSGTPRRNRVGGSTVISSSWKTEAGRPSWKVMVLFDCTTWQHGPKIHKPALDVILCIVTEMPSYVQPVCSGYGSREQGEF